MTHTRYLIIVIRKNEKSPDFSCCDVLQPVFMVKSAEYWNGNNAVIFRNVVPLDLKFNLPESEVLTSGPRRECGRPRL
jgi:hypothetical protein